MNISVTTVYYLALLIVKCVVATHYLPSCLWMGRQCVYSYSYLNVLFKVNNININLCCRSSVMNVSGGTIYSMYKQEKYVNKKLDPQKKKNVYSR